MLSHFSALALAIMLCCTLMCHCQVSAADECKESFDPSGWYADHTVGVTSSVRTCSPGSPASGGSPQSQWSQSGTGSSQGSGGGALSGCFNRDGQQVPCTAGGYWWSSAYNLWCKVADAAYRAERGDQHKNPDGTLYRCHGLVYHLPSDEPIFWGPGQYVAPWDRAAPRRGVPSVETRRTSGREGVECLAGIAEGSGEGSDG